MHAYAFTVLQCVHTPNAEAVIHISGIIFIKRNGIIQYRGFSIDVDSCSVALAVSGAVFKSHGDRHGAARGNVVKQPKLHPCHEALDITRTAFSVLNSSCRTLCNRRVALWLV